MRLRTATAALVIAALAGLLLAGCGGQSDAQQVRNVVNQFTVEVGNHNPAACSLMTPHFRAGTAKLTVLIQNSYSAKPDCGQVIRDSQQLGSAAPTGFGSFASLTISKVVITGSAATVAFAGSSEVVRLVKQNGNWLVNSA